MLLLQETETLAPEGKKAPTRHRLIVAAAILFQRRGYYGVGTEEILRLAKAPRGSFYHHFPEGKVALACAAVDWVSQQAVSYSRQLRLAGHSPMKVVKSTVSGIATWMEAQDFTEGSLLAAMAACLDGLNEPLGKHVRAAYEQLALEYEQMLCVSGFQKRTASKIANEIVVIVEGATLLARAQKSVTPLNEAAKRLVDIIDAERPQT